MSGRHPSINATPPEQSLLVNDPGPWRDSFNGSVSIAAPRSLTRPHTPASRAITPVEDVQHQDEIEDELIWIDDADDAQAAQIVKDLEELRREQNPPATEQEAIQRIERETADMNTRLPLQKAALYVRDCMVGYHFPFRDDRIEWYRFYRSNTFHRVVSVAVMLNLFLAMLRVHGNQDVLHEFDFPAWHELILSVEVGCLLVFAAQCYLQYKFIGFDEYIRHHMCMTLLAATIVYGVDLFVVPFMYGATPLSDNRVMFRFYVRPIFAAMHFNSLRETLPSIYKTAYALVPVVMFIFAFICIFAIYGFMLFHKRNTYFASSPWALYQLLIALTTANFPDVMVESYAHPYNVSTTISEPVYNPATGEHTTTQTWTVTKNDTTSFDLSWGSFSWHGSPLFFVLFYLVGLYFLLSVAFAVVYNVYKEHLKRAVLTRYSFRQRMLGKAYHCAVHYIDEGYDEFNRRLSDIRTRGQSVFVPAAARPSVMLHDLAPTEPPTNSCLGDDDGTDRMTTLLQGFRERGMSAIENQRSMPKRRDKGRNPTSSSRSLPTEVNQYIFTLIYNELFFPHAKHTLRSDTEIEEGGVVGLRVDIVDEEGYVEIPMGTAGIVRSLPNNSAAGVQCVFSGRLKVVAAQDIVPILPADSKEKLTRVLFHSMDLNDSGTLDMKQFRALYQMLQLKVTIVRDSRLFAERVLPDRMFNSGVVQAVLRFGRSRWLTRIIDLCIIGSIVLMTFHFEYITREGIEKKAHEVNELPDVWYAFMYAEIFVGLIFDVEALLKILSFGWTEYWSKKWNRFDFTITFCNACIYVSFAILAAIYGMRSSTWMVMYIDNSDNRVHDKTPDLIMLVLLGRLLRCLRIICENKYFRYILKTFMNVLPVFGAYIAALMIVYYYFASVGMLLFQDVEIPYGTAYSNSNYYALNFNSFWNSCVTLWCLMVVNNWFIIVDGYRAAKGDWVLLYFVTFWLISVLLLMDIVTAVVVEVWGSQWELNKEKAVNIDKNPLAMRIQNLNLLTPDDGDIYFQLGLPPETDGSRPRYKVSYKNYSHKVRLALERIFLSQKGFEHVIV
ncbi:Two pore calcium channel protein 1 [Diplonema papillatum]|nr:Two pore calcium channel protein 1 [Diplonema papillatum]